MSIRPRQIEILALPSLGFRLTEQAQHPDRVTGTLEQAIQLRTKRLIGQGARTLEKPGRANAAGAQALVNHLTQHRQQRRDTHPGSQQHQRPTFMGRHGEMPLRRAGLQHITDANLFMQVRRHQTVTLHADTEKIIGRRTRQAVGADMHLAINVEAQRQMLPGLEHRQSGAIGWLQIDRADVVAFRFDPHHPQRPPLITQSLGLQTSRGLLPGARQQTGGRNAVEAPAQSQGGGATHNAVPRGTSTAARHLERLRPAGLQE